MYVEGSVIVAIEENKRLVISSLRSRFIVPYNLRLSLSPFRLFIFESYTIKDVYILFAIFTYILFNSCYIK